MMLEDRYILLAHKKSTGQISDDEIRELNAWENLDPANGFFLEELESIWASSAQYKPGIKHDSAAAKAFFFKSNFLHLEKPVVTRVNAGRRYFRIYQWSALAASLLVLLAAVLFFNPQRNGLPDFMEGQELTISFQESKQIEFMELPDGSKIWLKPGTRISLSDDFNQQDRTIYLLGDVYMKVKKDHTRPFRILMEKCQLQVLGTSFYLNSPEKGMTHLRLEEGKVLFQGTKTNITLEESGEIYFDTVLDSVIRPEVLNEDSGDWVNDFLIFENANLKEVFDKLSKHYGVFFQIECPKIDKMRGFTSFIHQQENPKLSTYLEAIKKVYDLEITKKSDNRYLVSGGSCY